MLDDYKCHNNHCANIYYREEVQRGKDVATPPQEARLRAKKTGKSFFVRNFTEYDAYFFVYSDGSIRLDGKGVSYDLLLDRIERGETVVVDEFHRLPREFWIFSMRNSRRT